MGEGRRQIQELEEYISKYGDAFAGGEMYASLTIANVLWIHSYLEKCQNPSQVSMLIVQFVFNLRALKINVPPELSWLTRKYLNLSSFKKLSSLIITEIKPHHVANLTKLRDTLQHLAWSQSLNSLDELLDFDLDQSVPWSLHSLNVSHNNIPLLDKSTKLIPHVTKLDLSHNLIPKIEHLDQCINLEILNLSFNEVRSLRHVNETIGNIRILSLRHNRISTLSDLSRLYSLEQLDLAHNLIGTFSEVSHLTELPLLQMLWLEDNPIAVMDSYRWKVLRKFAIKYETFLLDDQEASEMENTRLRNEKHKLQKVQRLEAQEAVSISSAPSIPIHTAPTSPSRRRRISMAPRIVEIDNTLLKKKKKKKSRRESARNSLPFPAEPQVSVGDNVDELCKDLDKFKREVQQMRDNSRGHSWLHNFHKKHAQLRLDVPPLPDDLFREKPQPEANTQEQPPEGKRISRRGHQRCASASSSSQTQKPFDIRSAALSETRDDSLILTRANRDGPIRRRRTQSKAPRTSEPVAPATTQPSLSDLEKEVDHDVATEEFSVERVLPSVAEGASESLEQRILILTPDALREADSMGNYTLQLSREDIRGCRTITPPQHNRRTSVLPIPRIEIEYFIAGQVDRTTITYKVSSQSDALELVTAVEALCGTQQQNASIEQVMCMRCKHVFQSTTVDSRCPRCKNAYLVPHHPEEEDDDSHVVSEEKSDDRSHPESDVRPLETVTNLTELDQAECHLTRATIPEAMEIYFSLKMFPTNEEKFVYLFRSSFLPFDAGIQRERVSFLLLSNQSIFLLIKEEEPKVHFSLFTHEALGEIKEVMIGLFGQWIRVRTATTTFVLISRNHGELHTFIDVLKDTLLLDNPVHNVEFYHCADLTIRNISYQFCRGMLAHDHLEFIMMGYLCVKSSAYQGCPTPRTMRVGDNSLTPVTLLIMEFAEKTKLLLCHEDYGNQPKSRDCEESDSQFPLISEQTVHSVLGMEIDKEHPYFLSVCFEGSGGSVTDEYSWNLLIPDLNRKRRFMVVLQRLWQRLFSVELTILDRVHPEA